MKSQFIYLSLIIGVLSVSFAAIFIKLADAPAATIALYRMAIATLIFLPVVAIKDRGVFKAITRTHLGFMVLGGFFLALHFLFWINSFSYTSVASSVFFVTTQPIFIAIASRLILKEKGNLFLYLGIAMSILGSVIIGIGDLSADAGTMLGNSLALLGSVMAASYFLIGRYIRRFVPLRIYAFTVYGFSAMFLLLYVILFNQPVIGFSTVTWIYLFLLALIPTVIGHTCFNWALKYLPAPIVSVSILGEPVGATLWAFLFLSEIPALSTLIGGLFILLGIYITTNYK